ncbi:MAG TPA: translation factor GTPase family protein [Streptosporangiaceae bacterium]|nr:translation factor GTPase family protein [Streptosporangiaceae bacterium]
MTRRTLNLGILAHVDAGKTTLTERLLYAAGVIGEIGSVDAGTTQTDSLALERQRGITIKSAVVSFAVGGVTVNLIDTPGHPDFIAEVERVLSVLDGAVLVISAVEGVQPQTRVLMRALRRLRIPALLFVNKIDRAGAGEERVLRAIAARLSPAVVPMGSAAGLGTPAAGFTPWAEADAGARVRLAELLAERDEGILAAYIGDELGVPNTRLRQELAAQTRRALVHPIFLGSAATGAGVPELMAGLTELLPTGTGDAGGPVSGRVFKIERGAGGEKLAYVRMFSGTIRTRDRLRFRASPEGSSHEGKVTAIGVFERGTATSRAAVSAGQIARLRGLDAIQIGDEIGEPSPRAIQPQFAPPTLESVIAARRPADRAALHVALVQLAEQDPLINVRQSPGELAVSLYGEVQKEVIQATLAGDFGIEVTFRETTTICIERPVGSGRAAELLGAPGNPFPATLGLRVDPAPPGSGVAFRLDVDVRSVPMYVYKTVGNFAAMMTQYVTMALREGPFGWRVTDCTVTMFDCAYISPSTTAAHFRKLTPLVLTAALDQAGTVVCEPMIQVSLEIPAETTGSVLAAVARLGGSAGTSARQADLAVLETLLPAARAQDLQRQLPGLTSGEGVAETSFGGYRPLAAPAKQAQSRGGR